MDILKKIFTFLKVSLVIAVFSSLFSCKVAKLVFYEHIPSIKFYETYNFNEPNLKPFIDENILLAVDIKSATHQKYFVWLGLYSIAENKSAFIEKATISINGVEKEEEFFNKNLVLDEEVSGKKGVYQNSKGTLKLFELGKEFIGDETNVKNINLNIFYKIGDKKGTMRYELQRRIEKQNIYPT